MKALSDRKAFRDQIIICPGSLPDIMLIMDTVGKTGQILTLFECKYSTKPIGKTVISEVERKIRFLKAPRNFTVERILITGSGITPALQKSDYFHHILGVEDLFKPSS